jgi:hypothetical protein
LSISWHLDVNPKPALLVLPRDAESLDEAHAAIELWEHYKRRRLDDTQRLTVEVMMATRAGGLWAAPSTGREMSRQNGKGDEVEVAELWDLVQRAARVLHTVHDAVLLATETQSRMLSVLEGSPDLSRLIGRVWRGTGQQMIEMRNGGVIWYRTRTGGGARGVDEVDRIVVDEAQHAEEEHMAAITPTQLASSNPQLNALGSAGISGKSVWWWRQRKRAAGGDAGRYGYVGHTAERVSLDADGRVVRTVVDPSDQALWWQANPALVSGRVGIEFFEEQFRTLGPDLFAREHLGVWDAELGDVAASALPEWPELADGSSLIASHRSWALAVSPDRRWASIGVAGRTAAGLLHVEWMEHRGGTDWIVDRVVAGWQSKRIPIRVQKSAPEGAFIAPLRERGVEVVEVSPSDAAQAAGQLIDAVSSRALVHLGQPSLGVAVRGAVLRVSSDGASAWSQRSSSVEITPLVAVTNAAGGVPAAVAARPVFWA